jgi:PilZ domain
MLSKASGGNRPLVYLVRRARHYTMKRMDRGAPFRWIKDCAIWLSHPYREYDRRRNVRFPADADVAITWSVGIVRGRSLNVSRGGICVLVPEAIPPGIVVLVRVPTIDRSAFSHVLRCMAREDHYEVALQFRDGLTLDDRSLAGFSYHQVTGGAAWNDPFA